MIRFLKKIQTKLTARNLGVFVGASALMLFLSVRPAHAFIVNWLLFGVNWTISMVLSIGVALEAWILGFILQINTGIVNSPVVSVGFPVSLSITNLFFVLAIVVIAIATILRFQTYGIKQALWRLVVIAIAVNFGLIIAGGILNFSDSLSSYFLNSATPTYGGSGSSPSFSSFASAIAGAFQPQQTVLLNQASQQQTQQGVVGFLSKMWTALKTEVAGAGQNSAADSIGAEFIQPIASLIFTIFFLLFMIIVLGVLIVMLIIRYVYLGYLLILLPLAWAAWIFPSTRGQWNKWWTNFIKQAFFAPIVLFFMWVAIQTSYVMSTVYKFGSYQQPGNPLWGGLSAFFSSLFSQTFESFLGLTVLLGVMLGGIFAAQSMSIKFADAGVKGTMGMAKGFGGWAARKGRQIGTSPLRGRAGQKVAGTLQRPNLLGRVGRYTGLNLGASYLGGALQKAGVAGAEGSIGARTAELKNLTSAQKADMMTRADAPTRMAILKDLYEKNELHLIKGLDKYLGSDQGELFKRYNMGEFFKKASNESGVTFKEAVAKAVEAQAGSPERDELDAKVIDLLKKAKNTSQLTKMLIKDDSDLGEQQPLGMDLAQAKEAQKYFVRGALTSFSGNALSKMVGEIQSTDQERIIREISTAARLQNVQPSEAFEKYERSSPARMAGFSRTWFSLPERRDADGDNHGGNYRPE